MKPYRIKIDLVNLSNSGNIIAFLDELQKSMWVESDQPCEITPAEFQKYLQYKARHDITEIYTSNIMNPLMLVMGNIDSLHVINGYITTVSQPGLRRLHIRQNQCRLDIVNIYNCSLWLDRMSFRNSNLHPTDLVVDDGDFMEYINSNKTAFSSNNIFVDGVYETTNNEPVINLFQINNS